MSKINKNNREKGNIGEDIACDFLIKNGYFIQDRNYLKKWGEIDIIAIKQGILNFIEVKSIINKGRSNGHRPEENVHELKLRKLRSVIQSYLNEKKYGLDAEFKFHIITIIINEVTGKSDINFLENIIL